MSVSLAERAARRDFGDDVLEWIATGMILLVLLCQIGF